MFELNLTEQSPRASHFCLSVYMATDWSPEEKVEVQSKAAKNKPNEGFIHESSHEKVNKIMNETKSSLSLALFHLCFYFFFVVGINSQTSILTCFITSQGHNI